MKQEQEQEQEEKKEPKEGKELLTKAEYYDLLMEMQETM